jgi:hypothetical protein
MDRSKRSLVWEYYEIVEGDSSKVVCVLCNLRISRGINVKSYSTTPLMNHLSYKHPDAHLKVATKMKDLKEAENSAIPIAIGITKANLKRTQPNIPTMFDKKQKWAGDHDCSKKINLAIAEMIAIDMLPYSFTERTGFIHLLDQIEPR